MGKDGPTYFWKGGGERLTTCSTRITSTGRRCNKNTIAHRERGKKEKLIAGVDLFRKNGF